MTDWTALFAALQKAATDIHLNRPLPPGPPVDVGAALKAAQAALPQLIADEQQHPGIVRAIEDVLLALQKQGVTWAGPAEEAVASLPGALAEAEKLAPTIEYWLNAFQPAPGKFIGIA